MFSELCLISSFTLFFFAVFLIVFLVVWMGFSKKKSFSETLQSVSSELNLKYHPGSWSRQPFAEGVYGGRRVKIEAYTCRSGENSSIKTRIIVEHNGKATAEMMLYKEGVLTKIGKALGMQDIQLGNTEFDEKFLVKGKNPVQVKDILNFDLQHKLLTTYDYLNRGLLYVMPTLSGDTQRKILTAYEHMIPNALPLKFDFQSVVYEEYGYINDKAKIKRLVDLLADISERADKT